METALKTVKLYGHLGKKFGKSFTMAVSSPAEAIRALSIQIKGFKQYLKAHSEPGFHIFLDKVDISAEELNNSSSAEVIKIVPVTYGSGGFFKIVIGAALMVITGGQFGLGLILSGISEMLFSPPKQDKFGSTNNRPADSPSYIFNGVVNTTAQGNPVPLCYGKLLIGSQVISAGLSTKEIPV
jgi:predicted phage tail protein